MLIQDRKEPFAVSVATALVHIDWALERLLWEREDDDQEENYDWALRHFTRNLVDIFQSYSYEGNARHDLVKTVLGGIAWKETPEAYELVKSLEEKYTKQYETYQEYHKPYTPPKPKKAKAKKRKTGTNVVPLKRAS